MTTVLDAVTIAARLPRLLPWRRTLWTPRPWERCHCGALADVRDLPGRSWCSPCKYEINDCECTVPQAPSPQDDLASLRLCEGSASPDVTGTSGDVSTVP